MTFHLLPLSQSPNSLTTMPSIASQTINLLVSSCLLLYLLIRVTVAPPPYAHCYPAGYNYTQGDQFQSNLNTTLITLPLKINNTSNGYYTTSLGSAINNSVVYVLLQCRGDVSTEDCQACAAKPATDLPKVCRIEKEAAIFYDECLVHYADHNFLSYENTQPTTTWSESENDSTDPVGFRRQLNILMDNLSSTAVAISSKFALGRTRLSGSKNIYGLVQCTGDISGDSCSRCLDGMLGTIPRCCDEKEFGWVMSVSCYVRYNTNSFFKSSLEAPFVTAPAPAAPADGSSTSPDGKTGNKTIIAIVVPTVIASVLICTIFTYLLWRKNRRKGYDAYRDGIEGAESLLFDLSIIRNATNNFSESEKLGQGGFGAVYKGILPDGREIAVKRLSQKSRQGIEELKIEVMLLAKLLHKNLVRLLGFCIEDEEKLLVYDYLPNGSLDRILFDGDRRLTLDWDKRYKIVLGIAQGLLYLHQDSQIRVIHRDMKASNILLDRDMNPQISDFGLARIFCESEAQVNTLHLAGTFGYMAPEYAKHGHFSVKSDVFSFGILVLEIVAGTRNKGFRTSANLQSYAWKRLRNGTLLEVADPTMSGIWTESEVLKCIQVGLLCVQHDPANRPTMSEVLLLLNGHDAAFPFPSQPAYFVRTTTEGSGSGSGSDHLTGRSSFAESGESTTTTSQKSVNYLTITDVDPR